MNTLKLGNLGINSGGGVSLPTPDALFDTRTGLVLSDSIGGNTANIGGFPMTFMPSTSGTDYAQYKLDMLAEAEPASWTIIGLFKTFPFTSEERRVGFSYPFKRNLTSTCIFRTSKAATVSAPLASPTLPTIDWNEWQCIGFGRDNSDNTLKFIWNQIAKSATDTGATTANPITIIANQNVEYEKFYCRGIYAFNKILTNQEITDIRLNGIFPSGADVIVSPWLDTEEALLKVNGYPGGHQDHWDGVKRYKGTGNNTSAIARGFSNASGIRPPTDPYSVRDSLLTGAYLLYKGYSRQGVHVIPYKTDGTKGSHSHTDDIEYLASGVIHNMADSWIDFSVITDADIKALFDKSNRTYWKASIELEKFYADGVYYWSPYQLTRDFIATHAQVGHENHLFASLRASGQVITGITALRIYKTNVA